MRNRLTLDQKGLYLQEDNHVVEQYASSPMTERHLTVRQVAAILNLSDDKVRRMFQDEPGVLVIGDQTTKSKRRYTTLRIPESVLQRVLKRLSNV